METSTPQKEHQWLQKLVGEWTSEADATMEPGKPPEKFKGTESVRSLGGLWILAEGQRPVVSFAVGLLISGSKVRVLDGPPSQSAG